MNNTVKSILAVIAGFVTVFVSSVATDMVVEGTGLLPGPANPELILPWMFVIFLSYRIIYTIFGGYITSRLAPQNPVKHAIILGAIGTVAALAGMIAMWNLGNQWYPIALVVTAVPCTWLGGKIYTMTVK